MSNGIPVSGLKQKDGHVPSTWTAAGRYSRESMKNPRLNESASQLDDARSVASSSRIFLRTDAVGRDDAHPLRWKSERKNGRTRAPFSRVYEIRGIQFDGEFALNGSGTRSWYPDPSRVSTRSAGMCPGARREINLNSRTRKVPALTRTSADHATFPLSLLRLVYWKSCVKIVEGWT